MSKVTQYNSLFYIYTGCPQKNVPMFAYNLTKTGTYFCGHPVDGHNG